MEKAARRAQAKEEKERMRLAGETEEPVNPMDIIPEAQEEAEEEDEKE